MPTAVPKVIAQKPQPMTATTGVNRAQGSSHYGQTYTVINAPGGSYHVYRDGRRVFVPAHKPPTPGAVAAAPPAVAPASSSAGSAQAAAQAQAAAPFTGDAQFFGDQARRHFEVNQKLIDYDNQDEKDQVDYQAALRQLAQRQPLEEKAAQESFNDKGLFYSGKLGESLNNLAASYAEQRANAAASLESNRRARTAAREALAAGMSIDDAAALAEAADRKIALDTEAADNKALVNESAPPKPATPKPVTTKPTTTTPRRPRTAAQMRSSNPAMVARVKRRWRKAGRTA